MELVLDKQFRALLMGGAILMVILSHLDLYSQIFNGSYLLYDFFKAGGVGVAIFLFISSYGLCHSFNNNDILTFYTRRLRRLFPAYFVFLILLIFKVRSQYSILEKLALFAMQCTGMVIFTSNEYMIEWYVPSIMLFYFSFPLLYKMTTFSEKSSYHYWLLFLTLVLGNLIGSKEVLAFERLAYNFPILILGMFAYKYRYNQLYVLKLICFTSMMGMIFYDKAHKEILFVPVMLYCISLLLRKTKGKNIPESECNKFLKLLGTHSFEIYLGQQLSMFFFSYSLGIYMEYALVLILTIVFSVVFAVIQKTNCLCSIFSLRKLCFKKLEHDYNN